MWSKILFIGLSLFLFCSDLMAESELSKYFIQLNTGYANGQKSGKDFPNGSMGRTYVYGAELGYKLTPKIRFSFSIESRDKFKNTYSDTEYEEFLITHMYETKVKSLAVMLNLYYDFISIHNFSSYLIFSMGGSQNKTYASETSSSYLVADKETYSPGSSSNFAYKVGFGSSYSLEKRIYLDIHYQYVNLGKFKTGSTASAFNDTYPVPSKKGKLISNELSFGIGYSF